MKTRPDSIPVPSTDHYPYIRYVFENVGCRLPGEDRDYSRVGPHIQDDVDFARKIEKPSIISQEMIAALDSLTDPSFEAICSVIKPRCDEELITSKSSLADVAARRFDSCAGDFNDNPGAFDQAQIFLLANSRTARYAKWADLAAIYNESESGQKDAIFRYFAVCHNRHLEQVLATTGPEYDLPESLDRSFESKTIDGELACYDTALKRWLREDVFKHQYTAFGIDSYGGDILVATGPTLELVLARCITQAESNTPASLQKVSIVHHHDLIAQGQLKFTEGDHPFIKDRTPKLMWSYADLRPDAPGAVSKDDFFKTLYGVEKDLGSQWSKRNRLESELGL